MLKITDIRDEEIEERERELKRKEQGTKQRAGEEVQEITEQGIGGEEETLGDRKGLGKRAKDKEQTK